MHFSEIIKLQFGKEGHTLLCILKLISNNNWLIIFETCVVTPICFSRIFIKRRKNTFELVGTVLKGG